VVGLVASTIEDRPDGVADELLDLAAELAREQRGGVPQYALSTAAASAGVERSAKVV
jgi:hypothetical protein